MAQNSTHQLREALVQLIWMRVAAETKGLRKNGGYSKAMGTELVGPTENRCSNLDVPIGSAAAERLAEGDGNQIFTK